MVKLKNFSWADFEFQLETAITLITQDDPKIYYKSVKSLREITAARREAELMIQRANRVTQNERTQ